MLVKATVAVALLVIWSFAVITGLLLWAAPQGQGMGAQPFILGLSRHDMGNIHLLITLIAVSITVIHIVLDWKAFMGLCRYLTKIKH